MEESILEEAEDDVCIEKKVILRLPFVSSIIYLLKSNLQTKPYI